MSVTVLEPDSFAIKMFFIFVFNSVGTCENSLSRDSSILSTILFFGHTAKSFVVTGFANSSHRRRL